MLQAHMIYRALASLACAPLASLAGWLRTEMRLSLRSYSLTSLARMCVQAIHLRLSLRSYSLASLARMCMQAIHLRLSLRSNSVRTAPPPCGRGAVRPLGAPPSLRAAPAPPRRFAPSGLALAPRPVLGAPLAPAVPRGRPRA